MVISTVEQVARPPLLLSSIEMQRMQPEKLDKSLAKECPSFLRLSALAVDGVCLLIINLLAMPVTVPPKLPPLSPLCRSPHAQLPGQICGPQRELFPTPESFSPPASSSLPPATAPTGRAGENGQSKWERRGGEGKGGGERRAEVLKSTLEIAFN